MKNKNQLIRSCFFESDLLAVVKRERYQILVGAFFSTLLALLIFSNYLTSPISIYDYPFVPYEGDGLSHSWLAQRAIEGWVFENPRSGYPFGSNFLDYPGSDSANLLLLKFFGFFSSNVFTAVNLFVLLSFFLCFITSYIFSRLIGLRVFFAHMAAISFVFLPFHFYRMAHLFYLSYFVVPIFFYLTFLVISRPFYLFQQRNRSATALALLLLMLILASFGVYYALFGFILLGFSLLYVLNESRDLKAALFPLFLMFGIGLGVGLNILPNITHVFATGANPEVAVRAVGDSEIFGFKFMQLLMPHQNHFLSFARDFANSYMASSPIINENHTSSLGFLGAFGLFVCLYHLFFGALRKANRKVFSIFSAIALVLFLFGTIGGLGSLFAHLVSPSIRGWNRISIFLAFSTIIVAALTIQMLLDKMLVKRESSFIRLSVSCLLVFVVLIDQLPRYCVGGACHWKSATYALDRDYYNELERSLPAGSAIFQMPYIPFPEMANVNQLNTYDHLTGFLHSKSLRWSSGGMKGRQGDIFYRRLSEENIATQLEIIQSLGFAGVSIDKRGYMESEFSQLIQNIIEFTGTSVTVSRDDGVIRFIPFSETRLVDFSNQSSTAIMESMGFDEFGFREMIALDEYYYFSSYKLPSYLRALSGLSGSEPWGRWADTDVAPEVLLTFFEPLPHKFILQLEVNSLIDNELSVSFCEREYSQRLSPGKNSIEFFITQFGEDCETKNAIVISATHSKSPKELGINDDNRKIAYGLVSLRIVEQ